MSLRENKWIWPTENKTITDELQRELNIDYISARLLVNRGFTDPREAGAFLFPSLEQLYSPWLLKDMDKAVERIIQAGKRKEKVIVYGDYDADGITACVLMVETLKQLGLKVGYYLPSRFDEGYGLHSDSLEELHSNGANLVITVDCGINARDAVVYANSLGMDMIITDHHKPIDPVNDAIAVINPQQLNCAYPFKELSGAGVAFKLAAALGEQGTNNIPYYLLDLVALGTVADVVPLVGENRVLVSMGLNQLKKKERVGYSALASAVSLELASVNSRALAFTLAPLINAAGRMGAAEPAAQLLLETEQSKAEELAGELKKSNQQRRKVEQDILHDVEDLITKDIEGKYAKVILAASPDWHQGVIGIVASRLVDRYNRPAFLISCNQGEGRGSARSREGFDVTAALADSHELLDRFGGHSQAAGFTIGEAKISELHAALVNYADKNSFTAVEMQPVLQIDIETDEAEAWGSLITAMERMEPFGQGNPEPVLGSRRWQVQSWRKVGTGQKHLKLNLVKGNRRIDPIFFSGSGFGEKLEKDQDVDLAFKIKKSFYPGNNGVDLEIIDLAYSNVSNCQGVRIIDKRGSTNRFQVLESICSKPLDGELCIYASTANRARELIARLPSSDKLTIITTSMPHNKDLAMVGHYNLILFDLPLSPGAVQSSLGQVPLGDLLNIFLLYSHKDIERNDLLINKSLPNEDILKEILLSLTANFSLKEKVLLPADMANLVSQSFFADFWQRVKLICEEIGLMENDMLLNGWDKIAADWPGCLKGSSTYQIVTETREGSMKFQQSLLHAPAHNVASCLLDR